nr:MAG TPA: hypothetical protein [Caudoviricetes sp.]
MWQQYHILPSQTVYKHVTECSRTIHTEFITVRYNIDVLREVQKGMVKMTRVYQAKMVSSLSGARYVHYFESLRGALEYARIWQGITGIRVYVKSAAVELPQFLNR